MAIDVHALQLQYALSVAMGYGTHLHIITFEVLECVQRLP